MAEMQGLSEALNNRVKSLTGRFNEEKLKLNELAKKLNESTEANGENSEETQKLAAQFEKAKVKTEALGHQLLEAKTAAKDAKKSLEELKKSADASGESMEKAKGFAADFSAKLKTLGENASSIAGKIEKGLTVAAKIGTAAIGAASAGIGMLVKSAIEEYANYEQLVGGVETLFKESSDKVISYAENAYKTAGLSANAYMETVTSFSASLLQSLGGDTEEAAEKADMAITDMSDNANKMGTDMSSIQNAYQGFAKMNYTMLDNLKLGYGGTKEEMERLIADANALNATQGKLTEYSIDSFADIVDAIHVVQTNIGITGTTAKEASTTIQGSVNSAKAAWHNLLIGIADDNRDFDKLVDEFVDSIYTAADNILPRVSKSLDGILKLVNVAAKKIVPNVILELSEQAPSLIEAGAEIVLALGNGIVDNLDGILNAVEKIIKRVIPKLATAFKEIVPKIAKSAADIIKELNGIVETVGGVVLAFKSLISGNWIGVGIGLITAGIGLARQAAADAQKEIIGLTDAEWDMIEAGQEAAYSLEALVKDRNEAISAIEIETKKTQDLWAELQTLVDENGNVIKGNEERVDYILGDLNDALGTEYKRNGEIIEQYQAMQNEISGIIELRRAQRLLESSEGAYDEALLNRDVLMSRAHAARTGLNNAQAEYDAALKAYEDAQTAAGKNPYANGNTTRVNTTYSAYGEAQAALEQAQAEYDNASRAANAAALTITNYEAALEAFQSGDASTAVGLLTEGTSEYWKYATNLKRLTDEDRAQLEKDLQTKQYAVEQYRRELLAGTKGYTQETLGEMETELAEIAKIVEEAANTSYEYGQEIATGIVAGLKSKIGVIEQVFGETINAGLKSMRDTAEIASPSKKTRRYGQFLGMGLGLGIEDETDDVVTRASGLMNNALGAMSAQEAGTVSTTVSGSNGGAVSAPVSISINVHADTDDLGSKIASELQAVLDGVLSSRGNIYRNGRTEYAY